ncbi:DUF397 domain-containing protein [Saccharomonospora glauca]|jgi:hypothetical protein|uniref:DUF397 domain-containing protein n=1 Tax=Saccharomonospora glauca K62 TaxID=928724 RepID=I1D0N4_9PSEU|nr:DUF397 domain-containing protein [Saccharomonospora glauca]EIE98508.1 protein of unknown function (DUF397) [Saccharomonospora glauca K62]
MTGPLLWKKSSYSGPNGNCVEFATTSDGTGDVLIRHSKRPDDTVIRYTAAEWSAFLAGAKDGEFDI